MRSQRSSLAALVLGSLLRPTHAQGLISDAALRLGPLPRRYPWQAEQQALQPEAQAAAASSNSPLSLETQGQAYAGGVAVQHVVYTRINASATADFVYKQGAGGKTAWSKWPSSRCHMAGCHQLATGCI